MADVGVERLHPRPVELHQRRLSQKVDPLQLLLAREFGLQVDCLLVGELEHDFATAALSGGDLGDRLRDLLLLQRPNEVFQTLQILGRVVFLLTAHADQALGIGLMLA